MLRAATQRKFELDKEYFENFIEPIWESFEIVHKNYVDSFLKCKKTLDDDKAEVDKILTSLDQLLENDSIVHSGTRRELNQMIENIPTSAGKLKEKLLSEFVEEINTYFVSPGWRSLRVLLELTIHRLNKKEVNVEATKYAVTGMLEHVHEQHERIASKYYPVKKELLT